jgi:hypothetical protein
MPDAAALRLDFNQRVIALEHLCYLDPDWEQLLSQGSCLVDELQRAFKTLLASQTSDIVGQPPDQQTLTEMHRLLRLLATDMAFCHAAQTPERQQQRLLILQAHAQQLSAHWQAFYAG